MWDRNRKGRGAEAGSRLRVVATAWAKGRLADQKSRAEQFRENKLNKCKTDAERMQANCKNCQMKLRIANKESEELLKQLTKTVVETATN